MKKMITATLIGGAITTSLLGAGTANADYAWVADESAAICNALSLVNNPYGGYDWATIQISSLQLTQGIGRAEAVAGMRQAAISYCPEHLSAVPVR